MEESVDCTWIIGYLWKWISMRENEMVSIIVPVYNVEKYISRCIESLVRQSYKNIEIVLVDDGSTDSSGNICEEYSRCDNRIQVIHKKNGGQGSARNVGLKHSKGEYISFLDSDDYYELTAIEELLMGMKEKDLDISSCNYQRIDDTGHIMSIFDNKYDDFVVDGTEAIKRMWYQEVINLSPWGKVYKRALWNDCYFEEYRYSEDYATMHKVYIKADRFGYIHKPLVNYTVRMDSAVRTINERKFEILDIADIVVDYISKTHPELYDASIVSAMSANLHIFMKLPNIFGSYKDTANRCKTFIRNNMNTVMKDPRVNKRTRYALLLFMVHPELARTVYRTRKKHDVLG